VVRAYLDTGLGTTAAREWHESADSPGDEVVRLRAVRVLCEDIVSEQVDIRKPFEVEVEYRYSPENPAMHPGVALYFFNEEGVLLFVSTEFSADYWKRPRRSGMTTARCRIPGNLLAEGQIFVGVDISTLQPKTTHAVVHDVVAFHVVDTNEGGSVRAELVADWPGVIRPNLEWSIHDEPDELGG
jgi:lipopolysaccharide transport system ATP-binding protein